MKYIILTLLFAVIGCSTNQNKIDVIEARSHNGELLSFEVKYDKIGIGLDYISEIHCDSKNWDGQNLLGKALTKVKKSIAY